MPTAALAGATEMAPLPAAAAAAKRTMPVSKVMPPFQPAALSAARVSRPVPFLTKALASEEKAKALSRVSVFPLRTSMELTAASRRNVRAVAKDPVTPKPVAAVAPSDAMVTLLAAAPSEASERTVRRPAWMETVLPVPPKLPEPSSTSSPAPSLVRT